VLEAELAELDDAEARQHLEYMILGKALFDQDAIAFLPNCVDPFPKRCRLAQAYRAAYAFPRRQPHP
jgi:hypothetical protein